MMNSSLPKKGGRLLGACLAAVAALWLGCTREEPKSAIQAPPVMVVPVQLEDVSDRIEATGQLLARSEATVAAQVAGQVTSIQVDEGEPVEAGQVVLEIDPERRRLEVASQRAGVAEARAQLADRQREGRRVESLRARGAASESALDQARTQLELAQSRLAAAEAQLGLAERALADSSVVAPFAGRLGRRYVSEGEFVSPGVSLFSLVALENMEVEFHLAERDSSRVSLGDRVDVRVAPFPDEVFPATVTVISPTIDPTTRTLRVKATVENKEGRLRPGLFARADLGVSHRENVVMIPEDAIMVRADGTIVFRMRGANEVERVRVTTGVHRDGLVEVTGGLAAGDVVVVRGQTELIDGSVVDVRTADGERPAPAAAATEVQAAR